MGFEHAPQPRIVLSELTRGGGHRQLAHQEQRHRFKALGEVFAEPFPWRTHTIDLPGLGAARPRQSTADLALMLKNVQMPPSHFLCVIVATHLCSDFWTALHRPELIRFPDREADD